MPVKPMDLADKTLRHLQEIMLTAVVTQGYLPGGKQQIVLPDLDLILSQPTLVLSDENLVEPIALEATPKPLRILSPEMLHEEATSGDVIYLYFHSPQVDHGLVTLTLQGKIFPHDPKQIVLGLSGIRVTFREIAGQWNILNDPLFFAG